MIEKRTTSRTTARARGLRCKTDDPSGLVRGCLLIPAAPPPQAPAPLLLKEAIPVPDVKLIYGWPFPAQNACFGSLID